MTRRGIPMTLAIAALMLGGCTMDANEATSTRGPEGAINDDGTRAAPIDNGWMTPGEPEDFVDDNEWWDGNDGLALDILDARLEGAIGPVAQLSHQASETTSYADSYWSTLTVTVDKGNGSGAAMAILDMEGDLRTLEPGIYRVDFVNRDADEWSEAQPGGSQTMYIIGCSGDEPGEWSFDQPADEAELEVTDDGDVMTINFTADFSQGTVYDWETGAANEVGASTVTGTIRIAR